MRKLLDWWRRFRRGYHAFCAIANARDAEEARPASRWQRVRLQVLRDGAVSHARRRDSLRG